MKLSSPKLENYLFIYCISYKVVFKMYLFECDISDIDLNYFVDIICKIKRNKTCFKLTRS